jgi:hypothetical protein
VIDVAGQMAPDSKGGVAGRIAFATLGQLPRLLRLLPQGISSRLRRKQFVRRLRHLPQSHFNEVPRQRIRLFVPRGCQNDFMVKQHDCSTYTDSLLHFESKKALSLNDRKDSC